MSPKKFTKSEVYCKICSFSSFNGGQVTQNSFEKWSCAPAQKVSLFYSCIMPLTSLPRTLPHHNFISPVSD